MHCFWALVVGCAGLTTGLNTFTHSDAQLIQPAPGESIASWIDQLFRNDTSSDSDNSDNSMSSSTGAAGFVAISTGVPTKPTSINASATLSNDLENSKEVQGAIAENGENSPYSKRALNQSHGIFEVTWEDPSDGNEYNITMDLSGCQYGLKADSIIGVYTFTNGTTNNETLFIDMIRDIYSLRHSRSGPSTHYDNHTAAVAQLALDEANAALSGGLICPSDPSNNTPDHSELRHLLANSASYWTAILLSATAGGLTGASIAATSGALFTGQVVAENVAQTSLVVASSVIIAGILNRLHERGNLDRAASLANSLNNLGRQPRGREAIIKNAFLAWVRSSVRKIVEQRSNPVVAQAMDSFTKSSPGGASCLTESDAAEMVISIGEQVISDVQFEYFEDATEQLWSDIALGDCNV